MGSILYTVIAELPDHQTAESYLAWLDAGHLQAVLVGGATSARMYRLDGPAIRIMTVYEFSDRPAFERYEREHAPALRRDGRARFGEKPGVRFHREVAHQITRPFSDC